MISMQQEGHQAKQGQCTYVRIVHATVCEKGRGGARRVLPRGKGQAPKASNLCRLHSHDQAAGMLHRCIVWHGVCNQGCAQMHMVGRHPPGTPWGQLLPPVQHQLWVYQVNVLAQPAPSRSQQ